jgi:PAS domain S-box-containing protein
MRFIHNLSIKTKLMSIILLVTLFALITSFALFFLSNIQNMKDDMENSMLINARLISEYSISPVIFDDKKGASDIINKLNTFEEIVYACIFKKDGETYVYYNKDNKEPESPPFQKHSSSIFQEDFLHIYLPIEFEGENFGTIYLKASTQFLSDKLRSHAYIMGGVFLVIVLLSGLLAKLLQKVISKPILNLADFTKKISNEGNYSLRIPSYGKDELALLYDRFNDMLEQIEQRQEEQRKGEEALRTSEVKYRNLFQNSMVGIFRINMQTGKVIEANSRAKEIFGNKFHLSRKIIDFSLSAEVRTEMDDVLKRDGFLENYEVKIPRGDSFIWASVSGRLFEELGYFEGVIQDITDKKQNIIDLQKVNYELDNFVYHASHDLRSPLRSVLGLINIIRIEDNPLKVQEVVNMIEKSIIKLDGLITDLLTLSRNNRVKDALLFIDFESQVKECIESFSHFNNYKSGAGKLQVNVEVNQNILFLSDVTRINIVLNNLISNAIKYQRQNIDNPYINIKVDVDDEKAIIVVEDNGEGIQEEQLSKIFDMFYRASESSEGSGLGLYIVKNVLEKIKGKITYHSVYREGTTFCVEIPNSNVEVKVV